MSRNTLFSMMRLLKKAELDEVAAFLQCPLHCTKPVYGACFEALRTAHPAMAEAELTDQSLFASAFGEAAFDDLQLRRLKSEMCRLLEDFLAIKQLRAASHLRSELLTDALAGRNDYQLYKETVSKRLRKLENGESKGKIHFRELSFLYQSLYYHPETERADQSNDFLDRHVEHLENYFALDYLETSAESLVRGRFINIEEQLLFLDTALDIAKKRSNNVLPLQAFLALHHALRNETTAAHFLQVKNLVLESLPKMEAHEKKMLLKLLITKANTILKAGSAEQAQLMHELYRKSVEDGLFLGANGIIDPNRFINIVITAAKVGEFSWAQEFTRQYKRNLPDSEMDIVECLCLGSIHFQQGMKSGDIKDYQTSLKFLDLAPPRSQEVYNLRIRSLSIRIYFELLRGTGDLEAVEKQVKNFESYLRSNRNLAKSKKEEYRSFLSWFRSLCRLQCRPEKTKAMVDQYLKELLENNKVFLRVWLALKAEELKKSLRQ